MPQPPALSTEQRRQAYDRSLELRKIRSAVKAWLGKAPTDFQSIFSGNAAVQGMKVYDLLTALPGIGAGRASKILASAGIPEKNTVRACGPKQRDRLFALIG